MQNVGKKFEFQFKKSVPEYCYLHRLKDSSQSFINSGLSDFSWENPCDFFLFDTQRFIFWGLELKSTKGRSISFHIDKYDKKNKMLKWHQIQGLTEISKFNGTVAGILSNFRDEINQMERTYFQRIEDFHTMKKQINKTSYNEMDLILNNAIKVKGAKLRVNYVWDIDSLLKQIKVKRGNFYE